MHGTLTCDGLCAAEHITVYVPGRSRVTTLTASRHCALPLAGELATAHAHAFRALYCTLPLGNSGTTYYTTPSWTLTEDETWRSGSFLTMRSLPGPTTCSVRLRGTTPVRR